MYDFTMKKYILIILVFFSCLSLFAASSGKLLDEWNKLSEDEKWLCLLTEPFLCSRNMSLTTVNPGPENGGAESIRCLEQDWGLYSKQDIFNIIDRYERGR